MCGDYYIGGRRFSSLSDLIGYYSYVSCLLKGEKLLSPVAPPEVTLLSQLTVAVLRKCLTHASQIYLLSFPFMGLHRCMIKQQEKKIFL